ncbi:Uncharacterized protein PCOAH_00016860 [Plasmodium coatneyi]|uniref:Uncharacterized protein n=1 Tax=Plasmodium coatneyi TaxID=208452 RepID=A0A1B1DX99_9APIC|nr:Uncharacterized protein PCOAH_00016860 [Plasmodium coatneyi]ANQ07441.1 Uncharacterized protein PCOAH_00016860 [Plasmodium coatneyi]
MDLHDKRNGEKHQLSSNVAVEKDGNEMVGRKGNTNKRIYMKYHPGGYYKEEEKENEGIPYKRNRRPSRTPPSIDGHGVDNREAYHLAKRKKKEKMVNELSAPVLSPSGGGNNPVRDGYGQDSYDGDDRQREGNKWKNNRGDHHHMSERKTYNIRKMGFYPAHRDTSPGEKRNLRSNSIPSSVSLKKGSAAQEDESTADEHTPKNRGSKIYKLKSKGGSSSFMCHPDGRRRRVSPTRRKSFSHSSVETSESFRGGKYAKETTHGNDGSDKRGKHDRRRRSYDADSPYEEEYPMREAKRGEHSPHRYFVEGRPHGAHLSGESIHREDETSSEYRRESTFNKTERNKIHKRGKQSSRSRSAEGHYYSRRKRNYSPPAEEDPPNAYRKKWQRGNYYHGDGDYEKELPPKRNHREGPSRGGSEKLSNDREDPNLKRRKKEYPQNREWREKPLNYHRDEENESATRGEEQKEYYDNHGRREGQRSGKYDRHSNDYSSRKRDRSEMDDGAGIYDQRRYYYPHGEESHPRGGNHMNRLNKWKGDTDDEEQREEFKQHSDQRLHHQFERNSHGDRQNDRNPRRNRSYDRSCDIGSDISMNELNNERMKKKKIIEFVQVDGNVEIELSSDADFTNWVSDDGDVSAEAGVETDAAGVAGGDHRKGSPVRIKFRNSHLRKFVLCRGQLRMGTLPPPGEWSHSFTQKRSVSVCSSDGNTYSYNKYAPSTRNANYKQSEYRQEKHSPISSVGNKYYDVHPSKRRGSHSDRSESPDSFRRNGYMSGKNSVTKYDSKFERRKHIPSVDGEANRRRSSSASAVHDASVECENDREGKFPGGSRRGKDRNKYRGSHHVDDNERFRGGRRGRSRGSSHGSRRFSTSRDATHNTRGDSHMRGRNTPPKISDNRGYNQMERQKDKAHSHAENYERRPPQHGVYAQSGVKVEREGNHRANGKNYGNDTSIREKGEGNRRGAQLTVTTTPTWVNIPELGTIPNYINEIIKNMNSSYEINEPIDMLNLKAGKSFRAPKLLHVVKQMTSTKSFLNFLERRKEAQKKWKMVARNIVHEEFKILSDSISSDVIDAKIKYLTSSLRSL